jgi:broad specificity phosphatase PhoE
MTPKDTAASVAAAHSAVTLELAKKESAEHMEGMHEVYQILRDRPLIIKAYALDDPQAPATAKTVHFVRHGQGFHNLMADLARAAGTEWEQYSQTAENPYIQPEILDAPLTEKGRQQALQLQAVVESLAHPPELVICSPNCRALQTGLLAFESLVGQAPFMAHEMVREETGVHVCDKRRPVTRQRAEFPQIDFTLLETDDDDPLFQDDRRESKLQVAQRIYEFMEWLAQRPEKYVAVNSHSGWLLTLFNGVVSGDCDPKLKAWFQTGEMRSVKLEFVEQP